MQNLYFYFVLIFSALFTTLLLTKAIIPILREIAKQPIYEDGPGWHVKKQGTPTMGGIGFILPAILLMLVGAFFTIVKDKDINSFGSILISTVFCLLNALVGVIDDATKIRRSKNAGLTPRQKLVMQVVIAIAFLIARKYIIGDDTSLIFGSTSVDLGWMYFPLSIIFILGIVNCANLTDGIDGLESSVSFAIAISTFFISMGKFNDALVLSAIGIGTTVGFLFFNIHPAKIFMGDTGSLFLGALCVCYAYATKSLPAYILIGGIYVVEGISVIAQVVFFKTTGKRIFKMAPLHHHFEKSGFDENTICIYAMIITFFLSLLASMLIGGKI